jgi:hypothetical protein
MIRDPAGRIGVGGGDRPRQNGISSVDRAALGCRFDQQTTARDSVTAIRLHSRIDATALITKL